MTLDTGYEVRGNTSPDFVSTFLESVQGIFQNRFEGVHIFTLTSTLNPTLTVVGMDPKVELTYPKYLFNVYPNANK